MNNKSNTDIKKSIFMVIGSLFILAGVICNEWIIARLTGLETRSVPASIVIGLVDLVLVGFGILLIYFRKNVRMRTNLALLFVTVVVCLGIVEIGMRLTGLGAPEPGLQLFTENPNGTGSYRLKPNLNIETQMGHKKIIIRTNSLGMRWREVSYDNPLKRQRIAFIGDSMTMGLWADRTENTFVGIFDSLMDREEFEVLNFGVGGYGLSDMELKIEEDVLPFEPDYIFLMFFNGNDFRDTYLGRDKYIVTTGNAAWDRENMIGKVPEKFLSWDITKGKSDLYIYRLLKTSIARILNTSVPHSENNTATIIDFSVDKYFNSYTFWSQTPYPEVAVKAKDLSLETLDNIRKLCDDYHIQLIVVSIPFREQVYASSMLGGNYNLHLPQKYIEEYSKTHSVPYLDLLSILRAYVRENNKSIYFEGTTHFNNDGHYITGKLVAKFFKYEILKE